MSAGDDALDVEVGADADLSAGQGDVEVGVADVELGLETGGGLGDLLDVEFDGDSLDESDEDAAEDEAEETPLIDLGDLFGS